MGKATTNRAKVNLRSCLVGCALAVGASLPIELWLAGHQSPMVSPVASGSAAQAASERGPDAGWVTSNVVAALTLRPDRAAMSDADRAAFTSEGYDELMDLLVGSNIEHDLGKSATSTSVMATSAPEERPQEAYEAGRRWQLTLPISVTYRSPEESVTRGMRVRLVIVRDDRGRYAISRFNVAG